MSLSNALWKSTVKTDYKTAKGKITSLFCWGTNKQIVKWRQTFFLTAMCEVMLQ